MKQLSAMAMCALGIASVMFGQPYGAPAHVDSPTSRIPNPPLRPFSPTANSYARQIITEDFTLIDDLRKIDPSVLAAFHSKVQARDIANRGERFNATDVFLERRPFRRFVLVGYSSSLWFILYEHGGIGYHHNLVKLSRTAGRWWLVAGVAGFVKGNTFEGLREALQTDKFFEQPCYPQD